jgi:hypothetical protein
MNKFIMAALLSVVSVVALAEPPNNRPPGQGGGAAVTSTIDPVVTSDSVANSSSQSGAKAKSKAQAISGSDSNSDSNSASKSSSSNNVYIDDSEEHSASSAAAVLVQTCQQGGSAQNRGGGFGVAGSDQLCDYWKAAQMAREAHKLADKHGDEEAAKYWTDVYNWNMITAQELLEDTEHTATAQRFADQLFKPLGLLSLLIWAI